MCSLVTHQSITTTLARAKEMRRPMEKLITLAKKGGLANRRSVIARLDNIELGNKLVDAVAPQVKRDSGYLRIERAGLRRGDNAEMAKISFVDTINATQKGKGATGASGSASAPRDEGKPSVVPHKRSVKEESK
jgi:large subunit ribosomal protein L17